MGPADGAARVRAARPADLDCVLRLLEENDVLHAGLQPAFFRRAAQTEGLRQDLLAALDDRREIVLIAEWDAGVVGVARANLYDTPGEPSLVPRRRAHLEHLVVTAAARRRGIGRSLVAAIDDWARRRGASQLLLTVWEGNEAARAFYRALGYTAVSTVLARDL